MESYTSITSLLYILQIIKACSGSQFLESKGSQDYCLLDTFEAKCNEGVIMIDQATYGRMKTNKCVSKSIGHAGCFVDVKTILESICSGRQTCSVPVVHRKLLATRPCPGDIGSYLTVSYSCLKVARSSLTPCHQGGITIPEEEGYISSALASKSSTRNTQCPFDIKPTSGKQINITLHSFYAGENKDSRMNPPVCVEAAIIKEENRAKNILICPSDPPVKQIHYSESNTTQVTFPHTGREDNDRVYLIHFKAFGCSNPEVPDNANFKRIGSDVTISCKDSRLSWQLTCKGEEWQGEHGDCNSGSWALSSVISEKDGLPMGMLLIIVIGIALGVLIGGFLLYLAINAFKRLNGQSCDFLSFKIDCRKSPCKMDESSILCIRYHGLLPGQQIQNPSYEKPFYNPNNKLAGYDERTIQRSSMIYGTQRRSYPNRQMPPPVPPPHADNAQMRPPSEISECNRQSHIYETPLFNSL